MVRRILVALGGTPFTPIAVRTGLELASRLGAELTGVTIIDPARVDRVGSVPIGGGTAAKKLRQHRKEQVERSVEEEIDRFETLCREAGVRYRIVREERETFSELCELWRYHDLTIIGLRGLFEYGILEDPQDVVAQLIDRRIKPILAVAKEYRSIERVLIAYNGSQGSARALKQFVRSGLWPDAKVRVLVFNRDEQAPKLLSDATKYCRTYGFEIETQHAASAAPREDLLPTAAAWGADLLVMGTVSRFDLLKKLILGSMTSKVLKDATIPLFLSR